MSQEEIKDIELNLLEDLKKLKYSLGQFETDFGIILTGDANGPYWNGSNAYKILSASSKQIDFDLQLIKNLEKNLSFKKR